MGDTLIDVDAFAPVPVGDIAIDGKRYPYYSVLDVDYETYIKTTRVADYLAKLQDEGDQMSFLRGLILKFIPTLPASVLENASVNKISFIFGRITRPPEIGAADPLATTPGQSN